jgi:hypothetical protein
MDFTSIFIFLPLTFSPLQNWSIVQANPTKAHFYSLMIVFDISINYTASYCIDSCSIEFTPVVQDCAKA